MSKTFIIVLLFIWSPFIWATTDPLAIADPASQGRLASISSEEDLECFGVERTPRDDEMASRAQQARERRVERERARGGSR